MVYLNTILFYISKMMKPKNPIIKRADVSTRQPLIIDPQTSPSRRTLINLLKNSSKPSRETLKKFGKPSRSLIIQIVMLD